MTPGVKDIAVGICDLPAAVGEHEVESLSQVIAWLVVVPAVVRGDVGHRFGESGKKLFPGQ